MLNFLTYFCYFTRKSYQIKLLRELADAKGNHMPHGMLVSKNICKLAGVNSTK